MKLALAMSLALHLAGAFEYRTSDPAMLFPYIRAAEDSALPGSVISPSMLSFQGGLEFFGSTSRPYSEKSLTGTSSALRYSGREGGAQLYWNRFGDDVYREDSFSLGGAFPVLKYFTAGISENLYRLQIDTDEGIFTRDLYSTDMSISAQPAGWIKFAFVQTGMMTKAKGNNKEIIYPEWSAGILVSPEPGFSLSWNITDCAPRFVNTFTVTAVPLPNLAVRGGYSRETCSFAGSISLMIKKISVTYGLRLHSYLGYTHSLGVSFSGKSSPPSIDYGRPVCVKTERTERIDINSSSYDDILDLPEMDKVRARRIILYREKIGPISDEALFRIGMKGEEVAMVKHRIYGLEEDIIPGRNKQKKNFSPKRWKSSPETRIKRLFRKMLTRGIKADMALKFSEGAVKRKRSIADEINRDGELTDKEKAIIRRLCGIR